MSRARPSTALSVLLATLMLTPALLVGISATAGALAGSGFEVLTDAVNDAAGGRGPSSDVVRLGATSDVSQIHLFVQVNYATTPPAPSGGRVVYHVHLTDPAGNQRAAEVIYNTDGTMSGAFLRMVPGYVGGSAITAQWVGNELRFSIPRGALSNVADGQQITGVSVLTHAHTVPTDTVFDSTSTSSYTVGASSATPPGAPTGLVATASNAAVNLLWNAPSSNGGAAITGYNIYRGTTSGSATLLATTGTNLSWSDQNVVNGQPYYYRLSAVNSAGEGPLSAEATATPTGSATAPTAPVGLQATRGNASATLVWNTPLSNGGSTITNYKVYRGTTSGSLTLRTTVGNVLTFTDTGLTNGQTYFYAVSAVNGVGESVQSSTVSVTPSAAPTLTFTNYGAPLSIGTGAGEPGVGVNYNTGNVMINAWPGGIGESNLLVARFDDTKSPPTITWEEKVSLYTQWVNVDPVLYTDQVVGRTFVGGLDGGCSVLSVTDNDGQSFTPVAPCALPGWDHPTIGSGPYGTPVPPGALWPNAQNPRIVYYCAQPGSTVGSPAFCARSLDGGITWVDTTPPWTTVDSCVGFHGHIRVANDGTAALPTKYCQGQAAFAHTVNNGLTWTIARMPGTKGDGRFDPSIAPTTNNWFYMGVAESDGAYIGMTKNRGLTWEDMGQGHGAPAGTKAFNVGALANPPVRRAEFAEVIAGDDQRAAFAFLGSTSSSANSASCTSSQDHIWHMYVAMTYDAGRTWTLVKEPDPVQRGPIGTSGACRNMLDFNDITVDARGRVIVGYGDGCYGTICPGPSGTVASSQTGAGNALASLLRQSSGRGLFAAFDDEGPPALTVSAGGPYAGLVASAIQVTGSASGGTTPYAFAWSVASRPVGSVAGTANFANPNAAITTFTPDASGNYVLQLSVADGAGGNAVATATLTANSVGPGQCAGGGVTIKQDSSFDGGTAGDASEVFCLRAADDASDLHFFIDVKGRSVDSTKINDDDGPLFYDLHLKMDYAAGTELVISTTWTGSGTPTASWVTPDFIPIPGKTATAAWEGNTLHVSTARSEILFPENGETLSGVHVDVNHCEGDLCAELIHDDLAPDTKDGVYTLGSSSGSGGGVPLPECGFVVASDPATDSSATNGRGSREMVEFAVSDTDEDLVLCWEVSNWNDRPTGAAGPLTRTRYNAFFEAPYEGPGLAYSVRVTFNPDGSLTATPIIFKGVCAQGNCQTLNLAQLTGGEPLSATVKGNVVVAYIPKSQIANPPDGAEARGWTSSIRDDNGNTPTEFDRAPNVGTGQTFVFGQTFQDTEPPAQVTGLSVVDPNTGDSLSLSWAAASDNVGVTSYAVKRSTTSGGPYAVVGTPSSTSFVDTGLTTGTTYYYVVAARDAANNEGPASAQASGTPTTSADTTPPSVPTGLVATGATTNSISISWSASSDPESGVGSYKVFRDGVHIGTTGFTTFSETGLEPDTTYTYTVVAVNTVGLESAPSDPLAVSTLPLAAPHVKITTPIEDADVVTPYTFTGEYSTSGVPPDPQTGAPLEPSMPWPVRDNYADPQVGAMLDSPEVAAAIAQLETLAGYVTSVPEKGGILRVLLSGDVPQGAPIAIDGTPWTIVYAPNTEFKPIVDRAAGDEEVLLTLQEFEAMIASGSPPGPILPGIQAGAGPGGAIRMQLRDINTAGAPLATFICTAAYLFEDPATGKYYLATAGHCLIDNDKADSRTDPANRARWVRICVSNCVNNYVGVGTYVQLDPAGSYHPVAFARQTGPGDDYGFIEIPASLHQYLRPWMWFWSGPNALANPVRGDPLVHYGHGVGVGGTFASQGRVAVATSNNGASLYFVGAIAGGDSGSAIGTAKPAQLQTTKVLGDGAAGIITHISVGVATLPGVMAATNINKAVTSGAAALGFTPSLVTQDATIRLPGQTPPVTLAAAITSPANGASFDPSETPTVTVTGTATFPTAVAPGTGTLQLFPARNPPVGTACGTNLRLQSAPEPNAQSCGSLAGPIGPVWETIIGPVAEAYTRAGSASPLLIDVTRPITATVYVESFAGEPIGVADIEVTLTAGSTLVGSQRKTFAASTAAQPVALPFSFTPVASLVPAGTAITMTIIVRHAVGPVWIVTGGPQPTSITIPLGTAPTNAVEVSVDDPTFGAASRLLVTGTSSWSAPWTLTGLATGAHTIYARATQTSLPPSATVSRTVNIVGVEHTPPVADFAYTVDTLDVSFTSTSTPGDSPIVGYAWAFGDGGTATGAEVSHLYAASGTYDVTLTVTDQNGLTGAVTKPVAVSSLPVWIVQARILGEDGVDWTTVATPAEGEAGYWSLLWDPTTNPAPGPYTIEARLVRDGATLSTATRGFNVPDNNLPPVVDAGADLSVEEGASVTLTATASDPDGDALTYAWTQLSGPTVALSGAGTASATFTPVDADEDATYVFRVSVSDGRGGSASDQVRVVVDDVDRITVDTLNGVPLATALGAPLSGTVDVDGFQSLAGGTGPANTPPTAIITDVAVNGRTVSASGGASSDPDGTIALHSWDLGNGATRTGASLSYTYPADGTFTITLTVTDDRGAVGQATTTVTVQALPPQGFVADAGDSKFVLVGDPVTLSASAYGATGAVTYTWDTDGDNVADTVGQTIQVPTTGRTPGPATFRVFEVDSAGKTASDTVTVQLYALVVTSQRFDEDVLVGVNDEDAGQSGAADRETHRYTVNVPSTARQLDAYLTWSTHPNVVPANPATSDGGPNDFDLSAYSPGGVQDRSSADFNWPEEIHVADPVSGAWQLEVRSYAVANDHYTLFANLTSAPASSLPSLAQTSPVCFSTPTQVLSASATGNGVTGAWDLDLDGAFDDATGLTTTTSFAVGSGAHLVRFRATTSEGYRATLTVALRVQAECSAAPSVVVIGIADTGINPYHRDFAGELLPYAELRDATKADLSNIGAGDVPVYHETTGALLPFTRHPASYIPGYPANSQALVLNLGGGYYQSLDSATWVTGHGVIPLNKWYWIPGTKIVGAIDTSDVKPINGAADNIPILDEDGHGTASASTAAGNFFGSCPKCVLAIAEGLSGGETLAQQPWIDFVSVSGGSLANIGFPLVTSEAITRAAAERGQTISFAAGNGVENAFLTPEQTYTSNDLGPAWTIKVGAVQKGPNSVVLGTGKPVYWSSFGAGAISGACRNNYAGDCGHSGTSAATPISTGHMAGALLAARQALGDTLAGQKGTRPQAIAVGTPVASSPWLSDGVLTRPELWNVAFHCASDFGTGLGFPGAAPRSQADFAYGGYGIADATMEACATSKLLAGGALKATPNADLFFAIDGAIRDELWGPYDGDGDGQPGGSWNTVATLHLPEVAGLQASQLDTVGEATRVLREVYGGLGKTSSAPVVTETYYLHAKGGCSTGGEETYSMDFLDSTDDDDGCGLIGTPPIGGELIAPTASYPATVTTAGFGAGSAVAGAVYVQYDGPGAPSVFVSLLANGAEVGRSAAMQVPTVGFLDGYVEYAFAFPTTTVIPADATLQLDVYIMGSASAYFGYDGDHTSAFTINGGSGGGGEGDVPLVTITAPAQGARFTPPATVDVQGTAVFPASGASAATNAYLRWDGTATTCGDSYLSLQDGPDLGNGCASLLGVAGGLLDVFYDYPYGGTLTLAAGGHVGGKIAFWDNGPSPGRAMLVLKNAGVTLGSQTVDFATLGVILDDPAIVDVDFDLEGLTATGPLSSLVFEVHMQRQGATTWVEHEEFASYITLPVATSPARTVQVSIDDPSFTTGTLSVSGTTSWSAAWDLATATFGAHTIYARAVQDGEAGPVASVGILVDEPVVTGRVPSVQVQAVEAGALPRGDGWADATLDQETGLWSASWDTLTLRNGAVEYHARLLADGTPVKTTSFLATLANSGRAPTLDDIPSQFGNEASPIAFTVTADDLDNEPLTLTASGTPSGATFTDHGDGTASFAWTPTYDQSGTYVVTITATDPTGRSDTTEAHLTVANVNRPPVLDAVADQTVDEGASLAFTATGSDPDGGPVTYSLSGAPAGASIGATTGAFAWAPTYQQAGTYDVTITATDNGGETASTIVRITVNDVNTLPVLGAIGDRATDEGTLLAFTIEGTDEDGDALTFSASGLPPGATFDEATRTFTWTPTFSQAGSYPGVTFTVSDGVNADTETITISVGDVNQPPVLDDIGDKAVASESTLEFVVTATDPDGDALTFSASGLPSGATFDPATQTFRWVPQPDQVGTHAGVTFAVSDGRLGDSEAITISVSAINHAPSIGTIADQATDEGVLLTFHVPTSDPDGDTVSVTSPDLPSGATLGRLSGNFAWTPGFDQAGVYDVELHATDGQFTVTTTVRIVVVNVDRVPVLAPIAAVTLVETQTASRSVLVSDPDGDLATLSALDLPPFATFTDNGDNTGTLALAPGLGDRGTYAITILAVTTGHTVSRVVDVTVLQRSSLDLAVVGSASVKASPLEVLTLTALVTNTGPQTDTFRFTTSTTAAGWTATGVPDLTLPSGGAATVTFTVTVPASATTGIARITATSLGNPTVGKTVSWGISVPVLVTIVWDKSPFLPTEEVTGLVTVTWFDRTPIPNAAVRVDQTPANGGSAFRSTVGGKTGVDGTFIIDFGDDTKSRLPGQHNVAVVVTVLSSTATSSKYTVGLA